MPTEPLLDQALEAFTAVLRARGRHNSIHDIRRAADIIDQLASARADRDAAQSLAEAQTNAVNVLRAETIGLRNEVAVLNGRLMARKHGHD